MASDDAEAAAAADDNADAHANANANATTPRERPWLLPHNRKLRHLQGLTMRNLTLTADHVPTRTRALDDDGLPSSLRSPTKRLALREARTVAHSRSSTDLRAAEAGAVREDAQPRDASPTPGPSPVSPTRGKLPVRGKGMRRRSTLDWAAASPQTRQQKLHDVTAKNMADTFFSLHVDGRDDPVYVSEVAERAMNPDFRFFDLSSSGPAVTRLEKLTVRVWAKSESATEWQYLIDFSVHLTALQFIGKTLGNFKHPLPQNCILFHMTDGIYTSFTDLPVQERIFSDALAPPKEHPDGRVLKTSTYDALMRLSTLDDCIQDAMATRDRLADEIEAILAQNRDAMATVDQVAEAQERQRTVQAAVAAEKRRVDAARRRRDELQASIQRRKDLIAAGQKLEAQVAQDLVAQRQLHDQTKSLSQQTTDSIAGQRRRICEDLQTIYPIEPVPSKSLLFTIRGLSLPNSTFDDVDENQVAAALSYVAHTVSLLAPYLGVILPYPITLSGSTSTIADPLAATAAPPGRRSTAPNASARTYPLFTKGVVRYRFEYAVFLLNKDIEILSNEVGIRLPDLRHTLPNLKYLLYVATAGKGEAPTRKAGGIRGLRGLRGHGRRGSMDSVATGSSVAGSVDGRREGVEIPGKKEGSAEFAQGNGVGAVSLLSRSLKQGVAVRAGAGGA